ncbi:unnamed protein product [Leptidea sinapis]|uniref:Uncharacterized protein n=1 Tax=Leptidea sinapis TaxID=189913 RepID=A0A5E4R249_9NEOP|nr:unnamed protein product [Leptidea sinapis]
MFSSNRLVTGPGVSGASCGAGPHATRCWRLTLARSHTSALTQDRRLTRLRRSPGLRAVQRHSETKTELIVAASLQ